MPALDAHHMRARLVSDLGTRPGQQLIGGWLSAETQPRDAFSPDPYRRYLRECNAGYLADQTKVAESFYITDDMMTLAEHAAVSMPDQWIEREDLPAEAGFLWLPRSIKHPDVRGRMLHTRALSWHQFHGQIVMLHWTDRDDLDDEINVKLQEMWKDEFRGLTWDQFPKLQLQHANPNPYGGSLPTTPDTANLHRWHKMLGVEFEPRYEGTADGERRIGWGLDERFGTEEDRVHARRLLIMNPPNSMDREPISAMFAAFCRLCQQTITVSEKEPTDRVTRRRSRNLPNNEHVTVINLRHPAHRQQEGETQVEWSHRWLRRGHWRRQWYGSGEDKHQSPVWIHEAVCGPEDKPLVIREHVTSLSR